MVVVFLVVVSVVIVDAAAAAVFVVVIVLFGSLINTSRRYVQCATRCDYIGENDYCSPSSTILVNFRFLPLDCLSIFYASLA